MRRYYIRQKIKAAAAFLTILILLPYIVSVFVNGTDTSADVRNELYTVQVNVPEKGDKDNPEKLEWTEYLTGVLAAEMISGSMMETLKAQAVLIRTNIYRELSRGEKVLDLDYLTISEMQEKWGTEKFEEEYSRCVNAVKETDNIVLIYEKTYPWLPFHLSSSGMTRSAEEVLGTEEYPYLKGKECPSDKEADEEIQTLTFSYEQIQKKCRDFLVAADGEKEAKAGFTFKDFKICSRDKAGYVAKLQIGTTVCTGDQFRDALSLPSGNFTLSDGGKDLIITTTGNGHGLGMSLWTANEMAEEGKDWEEILEFFFEGTSVKKDASESDLLLEE